MADKLPVHHVFIFFVEMKAAPRAGKYLFNIFGFVQIFFAPVKNMAVIVGYGGDIQRRLLAPLNFQRQGGNLQNFFFKRQIFH